LNKQQEGFCEEVLGSVICIFVIAGLMVSSASALKYYTKYTFVKHEHPHELYYIGTVGVRGADWIKTGIEWCWPKHSRITYLVPYHDPQSKKVEALDQNDDVHRVDTIVVFDTWVPFAPKTEVKWDIQLRHRPLGDPIPEGAIK